jgi:transketolase
MRLIGKTVMETKTLVNAPGFAERAYRIRRNALRMGEVQGQGYIAQALDIADVLAAAYFHAMRFRPEVHPGRDEIGFCFRMGTMPSHSMRH